MKFEWPYTNKTFIYPEPWLMFKTHGSIVVGWVAMSIFAAMALLFAVWYRYGWLSTNSAVHRILMQTYLLSALYMALANEQYFVVRADGIRVNILLAVANAIMWYLTVIGTGFAVCLPGADYHTVERISRAAIAAQVLFLLGGLAWNDSRYGFYSYGVVLLVYTIFTVVVGRTTEALANHTQARRLQWLISAVFLTLFYQFVMLLGHGFGGGLSLSGAISASSILHFCSVLFQIFVHKYWERRSDMVISLPPEEAPA